MPAILNELKKKLSFFTRKMPNTMKNLEICEKIIKEQLIPNLVSKDTLNPQFRETSSLHLLKWTALTSSRHPILKAI